MVSPVKRKPSAETEGLGRTVTSLLRVFAVFLLISGGRAILGQAKPHLPPQGIIPDEITAVKIAEVVFPRIFEEEEVAKYLPYHAQLKDGVWEVYGTLKPGSRGGTPQMTIQRKDGKVIDVWHSQ
jgi:hypothetical protein